MKLPSSLKKLPGLSLVEVLLSVTLLTIMSFVMLPIAQNMLTMNELDTAITTLASNLRNAQTSAKTGKGDATWGLKINANQIIIFKGANYAARDVNFDALATISTKIVVTGTDEVVFSKMEGRASFPGTPSTPGTISLKLDNQTKTISINPRGGLIY